MTGYRYPLKCVEQFPDKINCVALHLVGYILENSAECLAAMRHCRKECGNSLSAFGRKRYSRLCLN
jgi:hypothetical protein